jgi:hypothetical protein
MDAGRDDHYMFSNPGATAMFPEIVVIPPPDSGSGS